MKLTESSRRYARALYEIAKEEKQQQAVIAELRALRDGVFNDPTIKEYFSSPVITADQKVTSLKAALQNKNVSPMVLSFLTLLAEKNRVSLFEEIVFAFEENTDLDHGVTRGSVRSVQTLSPEARKKLEETVNQVTGKKVILSYQQDSKLIGGLIAQVGGWTFDDTLDSHLRRLNEELKRSAN